MGILGSASRRAVTGLALLLAIALGHLEAAGGQLTLSWVDASGGELGFAVERSTGEPGTFDEIGEAAAGATTYVDSTVADGKTYCYRVRAFNASAYSAYSNAACSYARATASLAVVKVGTGSGTVTSTPSSIICGSSCSGRYHGGTTVTLTATAEPGSVFTGWRGARCAGTGACVVSLTSRTTITATFAQAPSVHLTVTLGGWLKGTVTSAPTGVICGQTCSARYPSGTVVTLTAVPPGPLVRFAGWSGGGCQGTGPCTITLTAPTAVTATWSARP